MNFKLSDNIFQRYCSISILQLFYTTIHRNHIEGGPPASTPSPPATTTLSPPVTTSSGPTINPPTTGMINYISVAPILKI